MIKLINTKHFLLLLLSVFILLSVETNAQKTLSPSVPTDTYNKSQWLYPFNAFWEYSWCSQIVTFKELTQIGKIPSGSPVTFTNIYVLLKENSPDYYMPFLSIWLRNIPVKDSIFTEPFTCPSESGFTNVKRLKTIHFHTYQIPTWEPLYFTPGFTFTWDGVSNIEILYKNEQGPDATFNSIPQFQIAINYYPNDIKRLKYYWGSNSNLFTSDSCKVNSSAILTKFEYISPCNFDKMTATALANGVADNYYVCPRSVDATIQLTIKADSLVNCSKWECNWFNGTNYWDTATESFSSTTPLWTVKLTDTISFTAKDSSNYTLNVRCADNPSCTLTSKVKVVIFQNPSDLAAKIGTPANGTNHNMNISWTKKVGETYSLDFSKDLINWSEIYKGTDGSYIQNTGDYPDAPCFYRIKTYKGITDCIDWYKLSIPEYTACDFPLLKITNPQANSIDLSFEPEQPVANPDYTLYSIYCLTDKKYVNTDGTLTNDSTIFQTKTQWASVTVKNLNPKQEYCFYAYAKNKNGNLVSTKDAGKICTSTLDCLPVVSYKTANQIRCQGDTLSFKIVATGLGTLAYLWKKDDNPISSATNSVLSLSGLRKSSEGLYTCDITNSCGTTTSEFIMLQIKLKPQLSSATLVLHRQPGDSLTLTLLAEGTTPFTYQWYKNDIKIDTAKHSSYTINPITQSDAGEYWCEIANECGTIKKLVTSLNIGDLISLYGNLTYDNDSTTVLKNSKIIINNIENTFKDSVNTDTTGFFIFPNLKKGEYILHIITNKVCGGIDPLDALYINRYYIGSYSFTDSLKMKAADVDANNELNPLDALFINRFYIGFIPSFIAGDWLFDYNSINIQTDTEIRIKGICYGDDNGSYIPE